MARQQPLPGAFVSLETSGRGYAQLEGDKFGAGGGGASRLVLGGALRLTGVSSRRSSSAAAVALTRSG